MTFGILRLGDAVQRWLRHPEPSSSSPKSTMKEKFFKHLFVAVAALPHTTKTTHRITPTDAKNRATIARRSVFGRRNFYFPRQRMIA